ncbi:hypothetical protein J7E52_03355 [Bacillus sp. ISL-34]|uniref:hypothetical protein n=1 Tax=Bacillus sp. ISL-34 TaxID=2819121 RepID=UPI001BEBC7E1|nr:hypothetical protein [Bacillus sp. ISL-34]MBT2645767.1 hypothetical protein [Bacillus sp. ISL-34]
MQTNIVIGTYRFVGFYVTQYFLNQGEEVIGIDWADSEANQYIMEEKELEIGRNSNYIYFPINKLKLLDISQQDTVFISCYDIQSGKMDKIDFVIGEIVTFIEKCKKNGKNETPNFVLFMPIEKDVSIFQSILSSIRGMDSAKIIYLPTIYGPWQTEGMSFEAGINQLGQSDIKAAIAAEYTGDALYITDFVNALEAVLTSSSDREIQLCSSIDDHWNKCAELIFGESVGSFTSQTTTKINKGTIFEVQCKMEPEEGIALQRKHNKRLNLLKKWGKRD